MQELLTILAQTPATQAQQGQPPGLSTLLFPLLLMGVIFYFLVFRPQSTERKRRQTMINAVKKNDRVVTIGGILGTVVLVKDDEITLKVDESNNTKITFNRSAIQRVVAVGGTPASGGEAK